MRNNPQPGEIYRHFKGNLYRVITLATHSETGETMVVYQALYGDYQAYVREMSMFMSEVDRAKYPDASQKYRFELIPQVVGMDAAPSMGTTQQPTPANTTMQTTPQPTLAEPAKEASAAAEPALDPQLLEFLDADTYRERLNLLTALHPRITDEMINTMAVALDLEVNEGELEERYGALKNCLLTMEKYECSRLR